MSGIFSVDLTTGGVSPEFLQLINGSVEVRTVLQDCSQDIAGRKRNILYIYISQYFVCIKVIPGYPGMATNLQTYRPNINNFFYFLFFILTHEKYFENPQIIINRE